MKAVYKEANKAPSAAVKEAILKKSRLQDVKVWAPKIIIYMD